MEVIEYLRVKPLNEPAASFWRHADYSFYVGRKKVHCFLEPWSVNDGQIDAHRSSGHTDEIMADFRDQLKTLALANRNDEGEYQSFVMAFKITYLDDGGFDMVLIGTAHQEGYNLIVKPLE